MNLNNPDSRRFYRKEMSPKLMFFYNNKTYSGCVSNFGIDGFEIMLEEDICITKAEIIPLLYFGRIDSKFAIEGIQVINVKNNNVSGLTFINVFPSNTVSERQYISILEEYTKKNTGGYDSTSSTKNHKLPSFLGKRHYSKEAINTRQEWVEKYTHTSLNNINQSIFHANPDALAGNIENYIGAVQIPLGIAGPIKVRGSYIDGYSVIPIATSEGALISSISRGARACNEAGGIHVHVKHQCMLRAPVFICKDLHGALMLEHWVNQSFDRIKAKAESVSSVAKLTRINTTVFGNSLHMQFYFNTADAAGQNMTTSCTWIACEWIAEQIKENTYIGYENHYIEANMAGDKKINFRSFIEGRGVSVIASVYIPQDILKRVLRVSADQYMQLWYQGEYGGLQTGMIGYNINFANVIAGIFTATGQDIACVHESSAGVLKAIKYEDGIMFNAHLPNLVIGTVGGGTSLPAQRECLEMMNCYGQGSVYKLAEIIASACVALDISTSAAICAGEFVKAHEALGRKKPKKGIVRANINNSFFNSIIKNPEGTIVSFENLPLDTDSGIITTLIKEKNTDFKGLFRYVLKLNKNNESKDKRIVLKVKSDSAEITELGVGIARLSGEDRLPGLFEAQVHIFGFDDIHIRELEFYNHLHPILSRFCPEILGTMREDSKGAYAIVMEDLSACCNIAAVNTPEAWTKKAVQNVLKDLSEIHSVYFDNYRAVPEAMKINTIDIASLVSAKDFLKELLQYNFRRYPQLISSDLYNIYYDFIDNLQYYFEQMNSYHQTLTHNDFNTRNICLRNPESGLVVYDWELTCYQNPQYDLIEFLTYALCENASIDEFDYYIEHYRKCLEEKCGVKLLKDEFEYILLLNALKLGVIRFNLYLLVHNICSFTFMDRVYSNLAGYLMSKLDKSSFEIDMPNVLSQFDIMKKTYIESNKELTL